MWFQNLAKRVQNYCGLSVQYPVQECLRHFDLTVNLDFPRWR